MVRTHPPTREAHWSCSGLWLFINRRSVNVSVQIHNAKTLRIQITGYVPYQMWAEANPGVTVLLRNSMRSFCHELLVSNFKGIPTIQQHGSADDNVPAFHSRRMNQLIAQTNGESSHQYVELKGKNHWFDGVMTTPALRSFYDILGREADWGKLPQNFITIIANPADMGVRGGLLVDQLITPDQLGKIEVERSSTSMTWVVKTYNILRFHFVATIESDIVPQRLIIDESSVELPPEKEKPDRWLVRSKQGFWHVRKPVDQLFHAEAYLVRCLVIINGSQSNVTALN